MSGASSTPNSLPRESDATDPGGLGSRAVRSVLQYTTGAAQFAAFCAAVLLPIAYLPLFSGGLPLEDAVTFVGLLGIHVFALVVGHGYGDHD